MPGELGSWFSRIARSQTAGLLLVTAVSWVIYQAFGQGFLSSFNLFTLSQLTCETAVIGLAQLVVVVTGRLNLAVGAVGLLVSMSTGWLIGPFGLEPGLGIFVGLCLGAGAGALMGILELLTGLTSFVVTLAMASIYVGIVLIVTRGASVSTLPQVVTDFGSQSLFLSSLSLLILPTVVIFALLWLLYHRSSWGWRILSVGANQKAAQLSGVSVSHAIIISFGISGLLSGVAGIMEMSRVAAALPSLGTDWLLLAFIVPVLGGTPFRGGSVSLAGSFVAALFIVSINSGLVSLNVNAYWQQLAQALVLLAAVVLDQARRRRRSRQPPVREHSDPLQPKIENAPHAV